MAKTKREGVAAERQEQILARVDELVKGGFSVKAAAEEVKIPLPSIYTWRALRKARQHTKSKGVLKIITHDGSAPVKKTRTVKTAKPTYDGKVAIMICQLSQIGDVLRGLV